MGEKELLLSTVERCGESPIFVGFDGAVDRIYAVAASRTSDKVERMSYIREFAATIGAAAGKSTNVERILLEERCGGNAVLCALALAKLNQRVTLLANVGKPLHRAFTPLIDCGAEICATERPNGTDALEFFDGKILLTDSSPLAALTYDSLIKAAAVESLGQLLAWKRAIVFTNWTMTPAGTEIFGQILCRDIKCINSSVPIFFDIADPARRSDGEVAELLDLLAKFAETHVTYLSVNVKEMERIASIGEVGADGGSWREIMKKLHDRWPLEFVLHKIDGAEHFGRDGWHMADGFFTAKPHSTTGGGDHFNGGFVFGIVAGMPMELALRLGNANSGAFVRSGRSPSRNDLKKFIAKEIP